MTVVTDRGAGRRKPTLVAASSRKWLMERVKKKIREGSVEVISTGERLL